uniref:Uncharacterized protein n=1 Tax=Knipowitschia caucasica TaxID=637954 RepID=A0AAV2KSS7_KNICA
MVERVELLNGPIIEQSEANKMAAATPPLSQLYRDICITTEEPTFLFIICISETWRRLDTSAVCVTRASLSSQT